MTLPPMPINNKVTFQLGDRADDHHDGAAQRSAGVEVLPEADVLDVQPVQLVQHFQEVRTDLASRSDAQTITTSNAAAASIGHELIEPGTLGLGAADLVGVFLDDLVAALLGHLPQVIQLGLRMLVDR